jgi:hypothetical protein
MQSRVQARLFSRQHIDLRNNIREPELNGSFGSRCLEGWRIMGLQEVIEDLSKRAIDSDLLALLAASRERRLYNAGLASELRQLVKALEREMDLRQASVLLQSNEIRVSFRKHQAAPAAETLSR